MDHVSISTKSVATNAAPTADATNSAATNNGVANNQTSTVENSTDQNQSNNQQVITAETATSTTNNQNQTPQMVEQSSDANSAATAGLTAPGSEQQPSTPEKQLDFTTLNKAIMEGNRVQFKAPYTEETNAAFKKAMNQAKHVMTNSDGNMTQADIDQAEKGLTAAIAGLKVIGGTGAPDSRGIDDPKDQTDPKKLPETDNKEQDNQNDNDKKALSNKGKEVLSLGKAESNQANKKLSAVSNPVSKNAENSNTKPEAKQLSRVEKYNSNSLPKTGMENNVVTSIIGLVMTLFVSLGLIKSTRTKTRKH